jgi:hypothetical protein
MTERSLFAGIAIALSAAAVIALAAASVPRAQAQGVTSPPPGTGKTSGETEPYWTPDRMRDAQPAPMPHPDAAKGKPVTPGEGPADAKPEAAPAAKPKSGG